jgi:O-antigen/teichoic acid export membrane protein
LTVAPRLRRLATALDPATRGWVVVVAGNLARLALGFVASVLIARALGPATFGIFATLGALASVLGAVADLGLNDAAVRRIALAWPSAPAVAQERARASFWLRLAATGVVVVPAGLLLVPLGARLLHLPTGGLLLALLGVVATALSGAVAALLQATGHFGRLAAVSLTNAALTAILALVLALTGHLTLTTTLAVLGIATSLVAFAVGDRLLPRGWSLALPARDLLRTEGRELLRFGRWLWIANGCALLAAQLDLLLVSGWRGAATAGTYALALNLAAKADIVNSSLFTVLLPAASSLHGAGAVRRYLRQGFLRSAAIGLALLVAVPLAGPFIITFYGADYAPAIGLCRLLLLVVIFDVFATPLTLLAYHFERPRLIAGADALRVGTLALVGTLLIPRDGAVGGATGAIVAKFCAKVAGVALVVVLLTRGRREPDDAAG